MSTKTEVVERAAPAAPAARILCALDFSKQSVAALRASRELARRWNAKLGLVCSTDLPGRLGEIEQTVDERRQLDGLRARLRARMRTFAGDDVDCWVEDGPPDAAIVRAARDHGAGLIVLGTHGRAGLPRLILGSTAEAVVAETAIPVLVAHEFHGGDWPRKVLAPIKAAAYSDRALLYAESFARSARAALGALHVAELDETAAAAPALEEHVERLLGRRVDLAFRDSAFEIAEAILREAETGGYDVIVMAAHRKPFWRDWRFGMTVQLLLRYSTIPVISVGGA